MQRIHLTYEKTLFCQSRGRSGAVAFQARAWVAARLNPRMLSEKWKAELDVQPSIQSLHLEAIRSLTKKQIDQNQAKTAVEVDGTYETKE